MGSTVIQHLVPSLVVSVAYALVSRRIANRLATSDEQQILLEKKQRKNNLMLMAISMTHFVSWLPINLFNVMANVLTEQQRVWLFPSSESMIIGIETAIVY